MGWFPRHANHEGSVLHSLQDIYYAEHQIEKALPDMIEKASDAELKKGFRTTSNRPRARLDASIKYSKN